MYTKLIVPLDTSPAAERALEPTTALARRLGVPVDLVIVSSPGIGATDDAVYLEKTAASLRCDVGELRAIASNEVGDVLVEMADSPDALVCMSTRGQGRLAPLLGSVATDVVRRARRPVLLFGPAVRPPTRFDVVAACVEPGSDRSHAAIAPALSMAMSLDAALWLLEVRQSDWVVRDVRGTIDGGEVAALAHELRHGGIGVEWKVQHDERAGRGLLSAAGSLDPVMLVMASRARAGIARVALGSVTMEVVHGAPCGVLVAPNQATRGADEGSSSWR
jgi:nucleotide-binding universal stress UspA family protein